MKTKNLPTRCRACVLLGASMVLPLTGCTNQQLYESTRSWRIQECQSQIDNQDYDRCMDGAMMSYEQYEGLRRGDAISAQDHDQYLHWTLRQ